jgi:uncharacterized heparinase superfamily protein
MSPSQALRLFHTVRHLQPVQVLYRAKYRVRRRARISERIDGPLRTRDRAIVSAVSAAFAAGPVEYLGGKRWRFLNREGGIEHGWNDPTHPRLWLYNLHYFNYLNQQRRERHAEALAQLIDDWVASNPIGDGAGWEPYPLSLRIVSWIKWASTGMPLGRHALSSLYLQARYLAQRLEYHLLGNHLFANAKALVYAGLFFDTHEASDWLATGLAILRREMPRQVLDDGGHFELSPMYHAIFVEDLLDIVNLASGPEAGKRAAAAAACMALVREPLPRMLDWLRTMTHPDGQIALFNDAAFGIARPYAALANYARRLGIAESATPPSRPLTALDAAGYVRVERGDYVALLDVARIGPDYLPGHAHADTLSFELSLGGQRLIVDAGTSTYEVGEQRMRERSTAAHNTVTLGDHSSSDVWSAFRVGRRAYPVDVGISAPIPTRNSGTAAHDAAVETDGLLATPHENADCWTVSAAHTGYAHFSGRIIHRRRWHCYENALVIVDQLDSTGDRASVEIGNAFATLRFAPDLDVTKSENGAITISAHGKPVCHLEHTGASARILDDFYHPQFGASVPCKLVRLQFPHAMLVTQLSFKTHA